ncbi:hypothetical protein SARC_10204 [Sphaeroforma arctica JP610]|uniref:Asparagine synthetase domain-containing protein n=1 Tax=Sphaeroforma arctica JP610 TaxID=667725 RepID=A0A0L0FKM8_9EUKA|nr:hypothetical protein SARC_10204 [Sphaeroforma arctica JP610]KNC77337.1 hypothetical protein SARC_10204 [Sphaeroforma arctica JP610]|eukprot:XP_014151239.1 hypothetical protein SARC_10204 [Sphaeroforma arctica JP610]
MGKDSQAPAFRRVFEASLADIALRTDAAERCLILSGGVDTCAILAAASTLGITFGCGITVVTGDASPDEGFSVAAAQQYALEHHLLRISIEELIDIHLPMAVKLLETFDGMTLRNSLVIAAAFQKANALGYKHVVVGDGADELFGGYSFTWGYEDEPQVWKEKRDAMCQTWTFATAQLAEAYGLVSHSPYTEPQTVEWALANTHRDDCIGTHAICLVHRGKSIEHIAGKIILREAYDTVSSWRRKDPIEVGSGITVIGKDPYWQDKVSDSEFQNQQAEAAERGFVLKNKEHLVNFRAFEECFGRNGVKLDKKRELGQGCAGCCFEIGDKTFCHLCGAWPAQRSKEE